MSESPELRTIKTCTPQLETALKGVDRELIHFLHGEGFFHDDVRDKILNPVTLLTEAQKAGELVRWITNRVWQDSQSYHTLVNWLKLHGNHYRPIVTILRDEFAQQSSSLTGVSVAGVAVGGASGVTLHPHAIPAVPGKQNQHRRAMNTMLSAMDYRSLVILYRGKFPWGKFLWFHQKRERCVNYTNSLIFVYYFSKPRKTRTFYPTEIILYTVVV